MNQITEDYVSFETAKLLKEKGFDEPTTLMIDSDGRIMDIGHKESNKNLHWTNKTCTCFTHQMVLKWLREVYKIHVEIYRTACGYLYIISNIPYGTDLYNPEYGGDDENSGQWTTYEKCVEAAILYVLKNLI